VDALSANQDQLSVYTARRTADGALTLIVINKTSGVLTSSIALSNFYPSASALVYRFSAANLTAIQRAPDQPVGSSGFSATFPSNSITLFVIPPSEPPPTLSGCRW